MVFAASPSMRSGIFALAALSGGLACAHADTLSHAVVETHTCANLSPPVNADPAAMQQISRAIALVHNTGVLPAGADRARVVLRLCFNGALDQPIIEVTDYSGPAGATQKAAERAVRRALNAGTLTEALAALAGGEPQNAVVDLVFGPPHEAGE